MEKIKITEARELCQLNGIDIYPVDVAWSTRIAVKINGKEKLGKQLYISETVKDSRGKWQIGYNEKINDMWLYYAAKIKKKLKAHNLGFAEGNTTGGVAAAGLPFIITAAPNDTPADVQLMGVLVIFLVIAGLAALVLMIAAFVASNRKHRE